LPLPQLDELLPLLQLDQPELDEPIDLDELSHFLVNAFPQVERLKTILKIGIPTT
jgi:hypothetical protein